MDKESFKKLFDSQFDGLRRYILYRSGDNDVATDIAQEAFIKLWEKRNKIDQRKMNGLLFKIATDLYVSRYRKEKLAGQYLKSFTANMYNSTPQEELEFEQLKQSYELALVTMGENQRVVFLMSRADGLKYSEIAEKLNLSVKAVEKRMNLALDFLRKKIIRNE